MSTLAQIGLGCVTFGREIDEAAAFDLLDHGLARRIRHFDTAAAYGQGASESILGKWLRRRGSDAAGLQIATKALPPYTPEALAASVQGSRERLGLATLPLLYLHRWDAAVAQPDTLAALDRLVRSGEVGALGASNFTADQLRAALTLQRSHGWAPFRAIQNNHNYAVRDVDAEMRRLCAEYGLDVVTYSPLGAGFLTGKHQAGVQAGSRFELIPGHQAVYFHAQAYARLEALHAHAARAGTTPIRLALLWALHQPATGTVLVGGRNRAQLDQALDAAAAGEAGLLAGLD